METFLSEPFNYWLGGPASVTSVHTTHEWPPSVLINGLTPGIRAWRPTKKGSISAEFEPAPSVCELDGTRKSCVAMHETTLAVGEASAEGLITVWDAETWRREHTLKTGSPVTALQINGGFLAAACASGRAHVWHRTGSRPSDAWQALGGETGLPVEADGRPCHTINLGQAPDGSGLLVGLGQSQYRVSVYKLLPPSCQLVASFARAVDEDTAEALAVEANALFTFMEG